MGPLCTPDILACVCKAPEGTLEEQVVTERDQYTLVFTGLVISITRTPPDEYNGIIKNLSMGFSNDGENPADMGLEDVKFVVEEIFKGPVTDTMYIKSIVAFSCTFEFEEGKRYLVYTNANGIDGSYRVGVCSRTQEIHSLDIEKKEIEILKNLREDE